MRLLAQLLACEHARSADPIPAGRRPEEDNAVAWGLRLGARYTVGREDAHAHRVDEAVVLVGGIENRVSSDGRDADAVPVPADPLDGALELPVGLAEPEAIEQCDRPSSHRDDVAEDAADPRRRALERLDGRGMVVALDLEGDRLALAEIDHARVLARALQHTRTGRGQTAEQGRRVLVRTVLGPEQGENRELEMIRAPIEQLADSIQLPVGEPEGAVERLFRDRRQVPQSSRGR